MSISASPSSTASPTRPHHRGPHRTSAPAAARADDASPSIDTQLLALPSPTPVPHRPDVVVFKVSTVLTVSHFTEYYDAPAASFPSIHYEALADGSLLAPPLIRDTQNSHVSLFVLGLAFMFFANNVITCLGYIRRLKIKRKALFYILLASQALGLFSNICLFVGFFNDEVDCRILMGLTQGAMVVSDVLLVSGTLGTKAYRCVNGSRIVLGLLIGSTMAFLAIAGVDMSQAHGVRRLSGSCVRHDASPFIALLYIVMCVQCVFICLCFVAAIWKSKRLPSSRGRNANYPTERKRSDVPGPPQSGAVVAEKLQWAEPVLPGGHLPLQVRGVSPLGGQGRSAIDPPPLAAHVPFRAGETHTSWKKQAAPAEVFPARMSFFHQRPPSAAMSTFSRLNRLIPRVSTFRDALRNELCYTAVIAASCCASAVLTAVGVHGTYFLGSFGWSMLNSMTVSGLVMQSFGKVVRRNENEALQKEAAAVWIPDPRGNPGPLPDAESLLRPSTLDSVAPLSPPRSVEPSPTESVLESNPFRDAADVGSHSRPYYASDARSLLSYRSGSSQMSLIGGRQSLSSLAPLRTTDYRPFKPTREVAAGSPSSLSPGTPQMVEEAWPASYPRWPSPAESAKYSAWPTPSPSARS